jgi:Fe2+ or Zn2+ uptake regulation protein
MNKFDQKIEELREQGFRITKTRKGILKILFSSENPESVMYIKKLLTKQKIDANKTTIYRELDFLLKNGFIENIKLDNKMAMYEICSHHHHHVKCTKCKKIFEIELDENIKKHEKKILKETGVKVFSHMFEFFGMCETCNDMKI